MTTIVTRAGKGSPLTNNEVDANFTNLNTAKVEVTGTPLDGQVITWDSATSTWIADTPAGGGTVTSVAASGGTTGLTFSGSPITSTGTLTLGGTLAIASGGTGGTTAADARANLSAAVSGANNDITSMSAITGGIGSPDYIQFDTAAVSTPAVGQLNWNDTDGTLEFGLKGGTVVLQIGQEQVLRVTNATATGMVSGQVVYITGSTGNHVNVELAQANAEPTSSKTIAVVTENISASQSGFATTSGLVRGLDTSALTEGAAVWLSASVAGGLTTTRPTQPNHAVLIGWCVKQHATVGVIYVHIANGYELDELHDVLLTGAVDKDVLSFDSASGLWKNRALATVANTGDIADTTGTLSVTRGGTGTATQFTAGSVVFAGASGVYSQDNASLFWDDTNNRLGIGTATPSAKLDVNGDMVLPNNGIVNFKDAGGVNRNSLQFLSGELRHGGAGAGLTSQTFFTGGSERMRIDSAGNVGIGTSSPGVKLHVVGSDIRLVNAADTQNILLRADVARAAVLAPNGTLAFDTGTTERMRIDSAGKVGIATTSPSADLTIGGSSSADRTLQLGSAGAMRGVLATDAVNGIVSLGATNDSTTGILTFKTGAALTERMRITDAGNVGIGTSAPTYLLDVSSASNTAIRATNTDATSFTIIGAAAGTSAFQIRQYGQSHATTPNLSQLICVSGAITLNPASSEAMRITTSGNVGIGTSSPGAKLHVFGNNGTFGTNAFFGLNGSTPGIAIGNNGSIGLIQGQATATSSTSADIGLQVNGGNVGIGTSSPGAKLDVYGTSATDIFHVRNGTTYFTVGATDGTQVELNAYQTGVGAKLLALQSAGGITSFGGNVGIGITSPASKLDVGGTIRSGTAGTDPGTGAAFYFVGSGAFQTVVAGAAFAVHTGDNNARTERMRIDTAGNVGIGTSSPGGKLDLNGNFVSNITAVAASAIDCRSGNFFTKTASGALTWTISNAPASRAYSFLLELTNGGTGTQTWFTGIKWPGGTAPTLTASGVDLLGFITDDGGTTWRGVQLMKDSK